MSAWPLASCSRQRTGFQSSMRLSTPSTITSRSRPEYSRRVCGMATRPCLSGVNGSGGAEPRPGGSAFPLAPPGALPDPLRHLLEPLPAVHRQTAVQHLGEHRPVRRAAPGTPPGGSPAPWRPARAGTRQGNPSDIPTPRSRPDPCSRTRFLLPSPHLEHPMAPLAPLSTHSAPLRATDLGRERHRRAARSAATRHDRGRTSARAAPTRSRRPRSARAPGLELQRPRADAGA